MPPLADRELSPQVPKPLLASFLVSSCLVASICYRFFTNEGGKSPEELQALRTVRAARTRLALRVCRRRGGAGSKPYGLTPHGTPQGSQREIQEAERVRARSERLARGESQ